MAEDQRGLFLVFHCILSPYWHITLLFRASANTNWHNIATSTLFLQICSHNDKICFTNNQFIPFELCKCYLFVWHREYILKHITMADLIIGDQSCSRGWLYSIEHLPYVSEQTNNPSVDPWTAKFIKKEIVFSFQSKFNSWRFYTFRIVFILQP